MTDKPLHRSETRRQIDEATVLPTGQLKTPMPKVSAPKPAASPKK